MITLTVANKGSYIVYVGDDKLDEYATERDAIVAATNAAEVDTSVNVRYEYSYVVDVIDEAPAPPPEPTVTGLAINPSIQTAMNLGPGLMHGATGGSLSFPANMQPAIAAAVDAGLDGAPAAWEKFQSACGINYENASEGNQFNIVPA